jgi:hypothetical protein
MGIYQSDIRNLLQRKIARYRALAREAGDEQIARRIQALIRELEVQLRADEPDGPGTLPSKTLMGQ